MQVSPLDHQVVDPTWQPTLEDSQRFDFIQRFTPAVFGMEVGREVVVEVKVYRYSQELADTGMCFSFGSWLLMGWPEARNAAEHEGPVACSAWLGRVCRLE